MEAISLFEWGVGAVFVGVNAYRRYNTPVSNRASTTFQNFILYFLLYLSVTLILYIICGAMLDSSPETVGRLYNLMIGQLGTTLPQELSKLSAPMVSALFLTILLPTLPWLSRYDQALLTRFWDLGHIPNHVQNMAAAMRRAPFNFSPLQNKKLRKLCCSIPIQFDNLALDTGSNLDFRWARVNALFDSIDEWKYECTGRSHRFMLEQKDELVRLQKIRREINEEFADFKKQQLEPHVLAKIERFLQKSIVGLFRDLTVLIATALCVVELSESGRNSRASQLGFEGGAQGFDRLSSRQIISALLAIFTTFLAVSVAQELGKPQAREFGNVLFMTFLMLITYGSSLLIALNLKRRVGMGYNELTRRRPWPAYLLVGVITAASWFIVTASYRYIANMLSGFESDANLGQVFTHIAWSYPYALQSLALAMAVSWVLDYHQSRSATCKLSLQQRIFDVGVLVAALGISSIAAFYWMEGLGWFEGYATKDLEYTGKTDISWFVAKSVAVAAAVGWLVPMWFQTNRAKAPDQIAGRLIAMNEQGLAREIRNLKPDELIKSVAAVAAAVAAIDSNVSRSEQDVYRIICGYLAGVPNSDVDTHAADAEFNRCLKLVESGQLELHNILKLDGFPLLASLMPYVAYSIALADGVFLEEERELVERIRVLSCPQTA